MKRSVLTDWKRAIERQHRGIARGVTRPLVPRAALPLRRVAVPARVRRLDAGALDAADVSRMVAMLRRHNPLLRQRFGITWAAAATAVLRESHRRGASPSFVARTLIGGLRQRRHDG